MELHDAELKILTKLRNALFWSTLIIAVAADVIFIFSGRWSFANIQPVFRFGVGGFAAGIALLIMKFVGFDLIPQLSEEANFPKKDLWKAFVGSIGCTVLIYGLAIIAVGGVVGNEWIDATDIVVPRVADLLGMHWLGLIIVIMGARNNNAKNRDGFASIPVFCFRSRGGTRGGLTAPGAPHGGTGERRRRPAR